MPDFYDTYLCERGYNHRKAVVQEVNLSALFTEFYNLVKHYAKNMDDSANIRLKTWSSHSHSIQLSKELDLLFKKYRGERERDMPKFEKDKPLGWVQDDMVIQMMEGLTQEIS